MRGLVIAAIVLAACSPGAPQRVGAQPSWRGGAAAVPAVPTAVTFAPSGAAVSRYNEPLHPPPRNPLNDAVIAAVNDAAARAKLRPPVADARLFRACSELAGIVPEEGVVGYSLVEFALQRNGIIEPSPHLLVVRGDLSAPQPIIEQLAPRFAEMLEDGATMRVGIGSAQRYPDGSGVVVFALQASGVTTQPIPRAVAAGGSVPIDAVVESRYRDPELFVTYNDGAIQRLDLKTGRAQGAFSSAVPCSGHTGRQQIEITASDASGSTVLANFPVWCGAEPPGSLTVEPTRRDALALSPAAAEQWLFTNVNRARTAAGLAALVWDDKIAAVARAHSEEMRRTHIVAHISPTTGSASDRVRAANIKTGVVLENVARAYGIDEAHEGLLNSPGHRANVMSPAATHVGMGVILGDDVSGRREMFVTQLFTRVPPRLDHDAAVEVVRGKLVAARPTVVSSQVLGVLAQQFADALAAGRPRDEAYDRIKGRLDGLGKDFRRVSTVISATADLGTIDVLSLLGDQTTQDFGIGVAQGTHPDLGEHAIWIIVLFGERR
jgi:uncharacterized protein YkwD